jgi:hypothetical protein
LTRELGSLANLINQSEISIFNSLN